MNNEVNLSNKYITLKLLPHHGGKLIGIRFLKNDNILYFNNNIHNNLYKKDLDFNSNSWREFNDYIPSGGYKCWVSPQKLWTWPPYFDLEISHYRIEYISKDNIELHSPICRESGLQFIRNISLNGTQINFTEKLLNHSKERISCGIWPVFQFKNDAHILLPYVNEENIFSMMGQVPKNIFKYNDNNLVDFELKQRKNEFKIGINKAIKSAILLKEVSNGTLKALFNLNEIPKNSIYPHNASFELYQSSKENYFELELHSPEHVLNKNDFITYNFSINFSIILND